MSRTYEIGFGIDRNVKRAEWPFETGWKSYVANTDKEAVSRFWAEAKDPTGISIYQIRENGRVILDWDGLT